MSPASTNALVHSWDFCFTFSSLPEMLLLVGPDYFC